MKTLVLHIGMAKTGTTTIQNSLGEASDSLSRQGITCASWKPYNHSFDFTVLFLRDAKKSYFYKQQSPISDEDWEARLDQLRGQWKALFSGTEEGVCIVSAENLTRLAIEEIRSLQAFVAPYFDRLRAIVYIRDPLKSLKSQWEQDVKELQEPMDGQALMRRTKQRLGYAFIERWSDCLGQDNLVLRKFEPAVFHRGSLLADFFYALGLEDPCESVVKEVESNQSLGADGAAFLLAMNSRYPQYRDGAVNPGRGLARRLHLFYQAMRAASSQPLDLQIRFDAKEAQRFNRRIDYLNQFLGEETGFARVEAVAEDTVLPRASDIGADYAVELVNELALLVDAFAERSAELEAENRRLAELVEPGESGPT